MNPADPTLGWRIAAREDTATVHALMQDFYAEEKLRYDDAAASLAVAALLADPRIGTLFLLCDAAGGAHGYFAVTLGFSLEFGGHFGLLDELFLRPSARGKGAGKSAIATAEAWAASQGIPTLRLEVNHHNAKAQAIYLKSGFRDDQRHLFSKRIAAGRK